eukprot:gene2615-biopygen9241
MIGGWLGSRRPRCPLTSPGPSTMARPLYHLFSTANAAVSRPPRRHYVCFRGGRDARAQRSKLSLIRQEQHDPSPSKHQKPLI